MSGVVGYTNPIWRTNILTQFIAKVFEQTETASQFLDMPPLSPVQLEDLKRSHLPNLDPVFGSILNPE
jgi:hypothetical protein